jgi:hypothetical protein
MKTTLFFQNLEAALPPGMVQVADPVARRAPLYPESATTGSIPGAMDGAHGGIVKFGCNLSLVGRTAVLAYA